MLMASCLIAKHGRKYKYDIDNQTDHYLNCKVGDLIIIGGFSQNMSGNISFSGIDNPIIQQRGSYSGENAGGLVIGHATSTKVTYESTQNNGNIGVRIY